MNNKYPQNVREIQTPRENLSSPADEMLRTIRNIIKQEMDTNGLGTASSCQLASAIVTNVNEDGSVDVYFPPNTNSVFTRISNQTPFILQIGDAVELTLKNGSFSNCWVSARHNTKANYSNRVQENQQKEKLSQILEEIDEMKIALRKIEEKISTI